MLYIEEIPRKQDTPFYTIDLTLADIDQIREWILKNCDTSKRHVIVEQRMGSVKAEGIQLKVFFGYDSYHKKPRSAIVDRMKNNHEGFKTFLVEAEALKYYNDAVKQADKTLDEHEKIARQALEDLADKGVNFDHWATAADDYNLNSGFCVTCSFNGFYFSRSL